MKTLFNVQRKIKTQVMISKDQPPVSLDYYPVTSQLGAWLNTDEPTHPTLLPCRVLPALELRTKVRQNSNVKEI